MLNTTHFLQDDSEEEYSKNSAHLFELYKKMRHFEVLKGLKESSRSERPTSIFKTNYRQNKTSSQILYTVHHANTQA